MDKYKNVVQSLVAPRATIRYKDAKGEESQREIVVIEVKNNLVTGLDLKKNSLRSFRTDRILQLVV